MKGYGILCQKMVSFPVYHFVEVNWAFCKMWDEREDKTEIEWGRYITKSTDLNDSLMSQGENHAGVACLEPIFVESLLFQFEMGWQFPCIPQVARSQWVK